ncbi:unnamed protein product [Gadus morhua 'NCC']
MCLLYEQGVCEACWNSIGYAPFGGAYLTCQISESSSFKDMGWEEAGTRPITDPAQHLESQFSVSSHLAALSLPSNSSALLPLIPRLWPSSTDAPAVAFQFHSITLKSRLTVMSYEMALLSSVSATYTLLCLIDAAVDEALRPHAVVT